MVDDGDRILNIIGVLIVIAILAALLILALSAINAPPAGERNQGPQAVWDLQRINETHVRIVHVGGEPVEVEGLLITVDGSPRHPGWSQSPVVEGDEAVLFVRDGQAVRLFWTGTPGDRDLLANWEA